MGRKTEFVKLILLLVFVNLGIAWKENTCDDVYHLNYTLPMFEICSEREHAELGMQKTIPKLVPFPLLTCVGQLNNSGIPYGIRVCQFPGCITKPCVNGWCEESMLGFVCHCEAEFTGSNCETSLPMSSELPEQSTAMTTLSTVITTPSEAPDPEMLRCPPNINQSVELGGRGSFVYWTPPDAANATAVAKLVNPNGTLTTRHDIDTGSFFHFTEETIEVIYTISDGDAGNESCSFNISFYYVDSTPPDVVCPADVRFTSELGILSVWVQFPDPTARDISGMVYLVSSNYRSGDSFPPGPTLVEYVFADPSGNNASCNFSVIIEPVDTTPPVVQSCPSNQASTVPVGQASVSFMWGPPKATDAAGIASVMSTHEPGVNVSVGTNVTVTYNVTDNSGLSNTSCSFNLSVVSMAPEWKCSLPKCYQQFGQRVWSDALGLCSGLDPVTTVTGDKDPSLLFVDSHDEFDRIHALFWYRSSPPAILAMPIWINCNDMATEGTFICDTDGTGTVNQNTLWLQSEPNGGTRENCLAMDYIFNSQAYWYDLTCSQLSLTICQLILPTSP